MKPYEAKGKHGPEAFEAFEATMARMPAVGALGAATVTARLEGMHACTGDPR